MLKQNLFKHSFHGEIETLGGTDLTMSTLWVEGIEIVAFIVLIYVILFRLNKYLFKQKASPAIQLQKPRTAGGMVGAHSSREAE